MTTRVTLAVALLAGQALVAKAQTIQEQRELVAHAFPELGDRFLEQLVLDVRGQMAPDLYHASAQGLHQLLVRSLDHRRHGIFLFRSEHLS